MRQPDHGGSGSPSIWITFSSFTYTFWPQPTAQYGQIDWTTLSAVFVRGTSSSERADRAARPSASGSPASWRISGGTRRRGDAIALHCYPPGKRVNRPGFRDGLAGNQCDMATDVEIDRALAAVAATLNDQKLEEFDSRKAAGFTKPATASGVRRSS